MRTTHGCHSCQLNPCSYWTEMRGVVGCGLTAFLIYRRGAPLDDLMLPDRISEQFQAAEKHPNAVRGSLAHPGYFQTCDQDTITQRLVIFYTRVAIPPFSSVVPSGPMASFGAD
uniref:Uncharacterized protein n=1 Tax=Timema monikensis TaxID=170555 RepID=A0A7R9ELT8_9NEOP|nr:unnamed protein product [Timema monikensis]